MSLKRLTYFGSYCWGDAMHLDEETLSVHGWKPYYFSDNQVAAINLKKQEKESPVYLLQQVEWQRDPRDMFFAKAKLIGYVPTSLCVANSEELNSMAIKLYEEATQSWLSKLFKKWFKKK